LFNFLVIPSVSITIHSAFIYEKQDIIKKANPYIVIKLDEVEKGRTLVQKNTLEPSWDESL
jgi:Ca2+-dependent lipid-binding protein